MPSVLYLNSPLLYLILLKNIENIISATFGVDVEVDGLGKIEAEDTHDTFGVHQIPAALEVDLVVVTGNDVHEAAYLFDGVELDVELCHTMPSFLFVLSIVYPQVAVLSRAVCHTAYMHIFCVLSIKLRNFAKSVAFFSYLCYNTYCYVD